MAQDSISSRDSGRFRRGPRLVDHLRGGYRLDFVPVLDLVVLALLVSLVFTRFVIVPGVRVDLPVSELKMQHSQAAVAVLTIGGSGMMFFDGSVWDEASIRAGFVDYLERVKADDQILLVKAESNLDLQVFYGAVS